VSSIGVAMLGYAFMGQAHSQGWRNARSFFDPALTPRLVAIGGRDAQAAGEMARRFDWQHVETDWRALVARDDVDLVDICTPGDTHAEIAVAALEAGKHVLCEKPLANSVEEAVVMAEAAARARAKGVRSMVGFTYRRVPATTFARDLVAAGKIGEIRQVRATYLQDWLADAEAPLTWRMKKELAGSGALGDIGAHIIDLTQYITGQRLTSVSGMLETFVKERPLLESGRGLSGTASTERGEVTVDDLALFTGRFDGGAVGSFEATRFSTGRKNALRVEIAGSTGAISFDLEDLNSLGYYDATAPETEQGFRKILVTEPGHPYMSAWWPSGHMIGYEHGFSHQVKDLVEAIDAGQQPTPSFADGLQVQQVLQAVEESSNHGNAWTPIS
jgi:predicted dehydrogenase